MYPRIAQIKADKSVKTISKKDLGEKVTVPDQAVSLKDLIIQSTNGFPVPMARQPIEVHPDLNQMLTGKKWDTISDAKFARMSKTQRAQMVQNLEGLKSDLTAKLNAEINAKRALDAQKTQEEITPTT